MDAATSVLRHDLSHAIVLSFQQNALFKERKMVGPPPVSNPDNGSIGSEEITGGTRWKKNEEEGSVT